MNARTRPETDPGIAAIEGYLLWSAEQERARRMAGEFADRLPWLTTAQREEVTAVYTADRLALSRAVLTHIAGRIDELRAEYTDRYRRLRLRCFTTALALAAALSTLTGLAELWGTAG